MFVHINNVIDDIKENNVVNFEVEMGIKGPTAVKVKIFKEEKKVTPKPAAKVEEGDKKEGTDKRDESDKKDDSEKKDGTDKKEEPKKEEPKKKEVKTKKEDKEKKIPIWEQRKKINKKTLSCF